MLKVQEKATKNNKDQNPPTPGQATTPSATAVANLAVESEQPEDDHNRGLFFCLRLRLNAMLALSPLLSYMFTQAIASLIHFCIKPTHHAQQYNVSCFSPQLTFCSEQFGAFYHCIMLRHWFIVMRSLGLYHSHHPCWRPRKSHSSATQNKVFRSMPHPAPNYNHLGIILIIYMMLSCIQIFTIHHEHLPIISLCAMPFAICHFWFFMSTRHPSMLGTS